MFPRADLPRCRFRVALLDACSLVVALLVARGIFALVSLTACGVVSDVESTAKGVGADLAELSYCEFADCGEVFLCTMPDATKNEWCWVDDSATELRDASGALSCVPTPRGGALGWPCLYSCTPHRGCNAYAGCWCGQ